MEDQPPVRMDSHHLSGLSTDVPEFRALIGNVAAEQLERSGRDDPRGVTAALRVCFTRMMKSEKKVFVDHLNQLVKRISHEG